MPSKQPRPASHFRLDLGGHEGVGMFRECTGLDSETTVIEQHSVDENGRPTIRRVPGATIWSHIVLKQGLCGPTSALWNLRQKFLDDGAAKELGGKKGRVTPNRISGTITQLGPNGATAKWVFTSGWVCKWEGPDFDASKNEISIESIEIAHEGLMMMPGKYDEKQAGKK